MLRHAALWMALLLGACGQAQITDSETGGALSNSGDIRETDALSHDGTSSAAEAPTPDPQTADEEELLAASDALIRSELELAASGRSLFSAYRHHNLSIPDYPGVHLGQHVVFDLENERYGIFAEIYNSSPERSRYERRILCRLRFHNQIREVEFHDHGPRDYIAPQSMHYRRLRSEEVVGATLLSFPSCRLTSAANLDEADATDWTKLANRGRRYIGRGVFSEEDEGQSVRLILRSGDGPGAHRLRSSPGLFFTCRSNTGNYRTLVAHVPAAMRPERLMMAGSTHLQATLRREEYWRYDLAGGVRWWISPPPHDQALNEFAMALRSSDRIEFGVGFLEIEGGEVVADFAHRCTARE